VQRKVFIKYFYLLIIKRADAFNHCSFGTNINSGAIINTPPVMPHGPAGIIIGYNTRIEENVTIFQRVTINHTNGKGVHVCKNAFLGAGCVILGDVTIGEGAKIGANAVVLSDIPPFSTAVGVPARIVIKKSVSTRKCS
jgi:serine O-acetyltransferase